MAPPPNHTTLTADSLAASGRSSEKQSLLSLQSKMKCDPDSYESELKIIYSQFQSSLELFRQQASLSFNSLSGIAADTTVAKELGERSLFLAHMTRFYPKQLSQFPNQLADLLDKTKKSLPSHLRCQIAQALILLINRKIMPMGETLALFMELQTLGDRTLRKLAYSHVVRFIQRMNKKHKDEAKNKPLQKILFDMLKLEDESIAKRSLVTLCDLHRRNVWSDERTVNAICMACFHPSSRIMIAALSFLLDFEKIQDDDDSDASSSDDEATTPQPHVTLSREDVYKAHHKGTTTSKKKKKAKLQRVMRSLKKQQRLSSEKSGPNYYSPLSKLKDPQGFAEKLFSRLQSCNERFEVKMMMLKVIARTIGLQQLLLLNFYPFLQKYAQPHQRDVTNLLAAAVQACHDMVPPDAVEPLFKQIVNQFVHDRSRTEAIAVGLNVVREICLRMPLLMTEDLLQDLVLYKKSHEKAVSSAARSLITLFREICPSLLIKKDRGRPTDPKARPKAYGEVNVATDVPGADMLRLKNDDDVEAEDDNDDDDAADDDNDDDADDDFSSPLEVDHDSDVEGEIRSDAESMENSDSEDVENEDGSVMSEEDSEEVSDADDSEDEELCGGSGANDCDEDNDNKNGRQKRKFVDFDEQLDAASTSLRALKKLTAAKLGNPFEEDDHIYSNEDFQRIKELQAKEKARAAMTQHGMLKGSHSKSASITIPSSDKLSLKPLDPAKLEANIRRKMTKEQRIAIMKAGREDRDEYKARTAVKQKKKGGLSNRQKDHKKFMPIAAKRSKVARSKQEKKRKQMRSGKQFRGKKAWK